MVPANPAGPVVYAFTLGLVAALNPCGFPMLPAYLALFTGTPDAAGPKAASGTTRITRGLLAGACVSAGFVTVFGVLGLMLEAGARWRPAGCLRSGRSRDCDGRRGYPACSAGAPALHLSAPRFRARRVSAGHGGLRGGLRNRLAERSLPLFLAAVAGSLTGRGFPAGLTAYLAYALGMGLFVTAAAVVATTLGSAAVRRARNAGRWLPAVSGITLTLSGAYLAYYWVTELPDQAGVSPVTSALTGTQGWLAGCVAAQPLLTATLLGTVVLAAIAVVIHRTLTEKPDTTLERREKEHRP